MHAAADMPLKRPAFYKLLKLYNGRNTIALNNKPISPTGRKPSNQKLLLPANHRGRNRANMQNHQMLGLGAKTSPAILSVCNSSAPTLCDAHKYSKETKQNAQSIRGAVARGDEAKIDPCERAIDGARRKSNMG